MKTGQLSNETTSLVLTRPSEAGHMVVPSQNGSSSRFSFGFAGPGITQRKA